MSDADVPPDLVRLDRRPEKIGRYVILERLGKGAMGVVYAARDGVMERDVALKVLMADIDGDPEMRARFFREAQVAAKLVHRNVVTIFDMGEDDGRLFIVMERLRGETLSDYLKQRTLDLEEKVDLTIQLCEGLAVATAAGVFHRDIKPGNLFIQRDGTLKIVDFGIARLANSSMTASGFIVGTPDFMSPEQAQGTDLDGRSDQFSVGAVLYLMLTGRKPFMAPNLPAVLHKVVCEDPVPLSVVEAPGTLANIVARALAKSPSDRYADFRDMAADLGAFRRRYDAETRSLLSGASDEYADILRLIDEEAEASKLLGIPVPDRAAFTAENLPPGLPDEGASPAASGPLRRLPVEVLRDRLLEVRETIETSLSVLRDGQRAAAAAAALLSSGDDRGALARLEGAVRTLPASAVLACEAARVRQRVGESQARDDRARGLLMQAAEERRRGQLQPALALAKEAAALVPRNVEATQLAAALGEQIAREAADRRQQTQAHLEKARRLILKERFKEAEEIVALARQLDPDNVDAVRVATQVATARAAHESADAQLRMIADRIAEARRLFDAGDHAASFASLEALAARNPGARAITLELGRQRDHAEQAARAERARQVAAGLAEAADAAWSDGDAEKAVRLAEQALAAHPSQEHALRVVAVAKARVREIAERDARLARASEHLTKARTFIKRGRLDAAVYEAQQASELDPLGTAGAALLAEILRQQETEKAAQAAERDALQRARAVRSAIADARAAVRAGDHARADHVAQQALALDPDNDQIRAIIASIAAGRALLAAQQDDTVDLLRRPPDPDDTAALIHSAPAGRYSTLLRDVLRRVHLPPWLWRASAAPVRDHSAWSKERDTSGKQT